MCKDRSVFVGKFRASTSPLTDVLRLEGVVTNVTLTKSEHRASCYRALLRARHIQNSVLRQDQSVVQHHVQLNIKLRGPSGTATALRSRGSCMAEVKPPAGNAASSSSQQSPDSPRNAQPNANANNTNNTNNSNNVSKSSVALMGKKLSSVKLASVGRVAARGRTATMNALNLGRSPNVRYEE